jgi:membrane fusion protein, copper/silver efflux system
MKGIIKEKLPFSFLSFFSEKKRGFGTLFCFLLFSAGGTLLLSHCKKQEEREETLYQCPMHPDYISPKPGNCPICGMSLVPIKKGGDIPPHEHHPPAKPPEKGSFHLSPDEIRKLSLRTVPLRWGKITRSFSTYGNVVWDPKGVHFVTTRFSGWVEDLFVTQTGSFIRHGEILFTYSSPEVSATFREYLSSSGEKVSKDRFSEAEDRIPEEQAEEQGGLKELAKKRLLLFGIPERVFRRENLSPIEKFPYASPVSGVLLRNNLLPGKRFSPEEILMEIGSPGAIWIEGFLPLEYRDIPNLHPNVFIYDGKRKEKGRILFVEEEVEKETLTLKVRIRPESIKGFQPGGFVEVVFQWESKEGWVVPEESILFSHTRYGTLFLWDEKEGIVPYKVQVLTIGDGEIVVEGNHLPREGRVITYSSFLLDAETRLRGILPKGEEIVSSGTVETIEKKESPSPIPHLH